MAQPQGIRKADYLHHVCRLTKAVYGLNKLLELGIRSSAPAWSLSDWSHPVQTCHSLSTHAVMRSSSFWFMLMI